MWSTYNPLDIIEGTKPIRDMEKTFGIEISDDEAPEDVLHGDKHAIRRCARQANTQQQWLGNCLRLDPFDWSDHTG